MSAIVKHEEGPLAFSDHQMRMIRDSFCSGASDQEFAVLMEIARVRRLNPLLKQIHFVKRWNSQLKREVWTSQTSIDGMRALAEHTGKYAGQDEPEYVYNDDGSILCSKVRVYRHDWERPAVGVAYWSEYVQTTKDGGVTQFWRDKPHVMIGKCAEAIALRKAFPEDLSGLYAQEEMQGEVVSERSELDQYLSAISGATNQQELDLIGQELAARKFKGRDRSRLGNAFRAKQASLKPLVDTIAEAAKRLEANNPEAA